MNELMASVRATPTPYGTAALWWLGLTSVAGRRFRKSTNAANCQYH